MSAPTRINPNEANAQIGLFIQNNELVINHNLSSQGVSLPLCPSKPHWFCAKIKMFLVRCFPSWLQGCLPLSFRGVASVIVAGKIYYVPRSAITAYFDSRSTLPCHSNNPVSNATRLKCIALSYFKKTEVQQALNATYKQVLHAQSLRESFNDLV